MRQFKIIFDPLQIRNAAKYLEQYNTLCRQSVGYWEDSIYGTIKESITKPDVWSSGTGGYTVIFTEDSDGVNVDVLVDPSVGKTRNFTEASYAFGKIIKEF